MRNDMCKVIVERPRRGGTRAGAAGRGRIYRASEDVPSKMGIKRGIGPSKWLNENLAPLKRYLASQVNRPWDKVYSEICANIDRRNTVQAHIFAHMEDYVELHARLVDDKVFVKGRGWRSEWVPLDESHFELYVHPRTGILLRNRHRKPWNWRKPSADTQNRPRGIERRILGEREQLHRINDIWYRVELADLPEGEIRITREAGQIKRSVDCPTRRDAAYGKELAARDKSGQWDWEPYRLYGKYRVYAVSKKQLGERELKKHGLKQKGRDTSRPFCFLRAAPYMLAV